MDKINIRHFSIFGIEPIIIEKTDINFIITYKDISNDIINEFIEELHSRPVIGNNENKPYIINSLEAIFNFVLGVNHICITYSSPNEIYKIKKEAGEI